MIEQWKNQCLELGLLFEIIRCGATTKSSAETRNVSSSGVLFTSAAPVEVGETMEYLITFPKPPGSHSEVRLRCVGKVLRGDMQAFAATLERYEFIRR